MRKNKMKTKKKRISELKAIVFEVKEDAELKRDLRKFIEITA